jgi:hypothetical protein
MHVFEPYIILFALVFLINVIPAFMPPTWMILSYASIRYGIPFIPTVCIGVVAATLGRYVLALMARHWFRGIFPSRLIQNYLDLGNELRSHTSLTIPVVLGYAFSPISSNSLFVVLGLSYVPLLIPILSFACGRLMSYAFWVQTTRHVSHKLDHIFLSSLGRSEALVGALISVGIVLLIGYIPWKRVFLEGGAWMVRTYKKMHKQISHFLHNRRSSEG